MKQIIYLAAILLTYTHCNAQYLQKEDANFSAKNKKLTSGIIKNNMDLSVAPGDNFMNYANGNWINVYGGKSSSPSGVLVKKIRGMGKEIIKKTASVQTDRSSSEQKIGDLYNSYKNLNLREQVGLKPLEDEFIKINDIATKQELVFYFVYANQYAYSMPLSIDITPLNNKYELLFKNGGITKSSATFYLNNDSISQISRNNYFKHIERLFNSADSPNATTLANDVLFVETELAKIQSKVENQNSTEDSKDVYKISNLNSLISNFMWSNILKDTNINKQEYVIIHNKQYFKELGELIKTINLTRWKSYLKWKVLEKHTKHLTENIYKESFKEYNNKVASPPVEEEAMYFTQQVFKELIGDVYIKQYYSEHIGNKAEIMVSNIIKAYALSIKELSWMSDKTKKEALDKVYKIKRHIGYVKKKSIYDTLIIKPYDLFGNAKRISKFNYKTKMAKIGESVATDSSFDPLTLNGYYVANANLFWVAGAFFQPPYFYSGAEDAINYGALGAVIGHEIGHAFDNKGSKYDGDGKLRNWWTKEDHTSFDAKTKTLINQYNAFRLEPDGFVNGKFSLAENIADLSGLSMAIKAYKMSLKEKKGTEIDGFSAMQRLFIGYAQMYCSKPYDSYFLKNPQGAYPPARYRVNGVVRNIPEFYSAFKIQPKDSLYLSPKNRVKIW